MTTSHLIGLDELNKRLRTELEAGGVGIGIDCCPYLIDDPSSPPIGSFERLRFIAKMVDYLATSRALYQATQVYEAAKAPVEECLKEMAEAALITVDKMTVFIGMNLVSKLATEDNLAADDEELRNISLLITVGQLRANIKRFPRIQTALEAEAKAKGKHVEDVLLSKLLSNTFLVLAENMIEPQLLSASDIKGLINEIVNIAIHELPDQREITASDAVTDSLERPDPYSTDFARQLEADDEYTAWLDRAGLSIAEREVVELKLQDLTEDQIAKKTGRSVGTVKSLLFRARQKFKRTHKT